MAQTRIFLQGDSITYGYSGGEATVGWGDLLKQTMIQRAHEGELPAREVLNFAVSSQTTDEIAHRFEGQIAPFQGLGNIAVFLVGVADSLVLKGQEQPRVVREQFAANLARIGGICVAHAITPIFVECGNVNEAVTRPWRGGRTVKTSLSGIEMAKHERMP